MTVRELKEKLKNIENETQVLTATDEEWNDFNYLQLDVIEGYFNPDTMYLTIDDYMDLSQEEKETTVPCIIIG